MYDIVKFLHVIGVFGFLMAHGASANAVFALRRERNLDRVRALLELSANSYGVMYLSLLVLLVTGVIGGFAGQWWGRGWIEEIGALLAKGNPVLLTAIGFGGIAVIAWLMMFKPF